MRLHRYLFTQYAQVMLMVLASLITVVWLNQALQLLELVVNKGSPLIGFLVLSVLALPLWLLQAVPIALFIAILWVINKITSDRELVAMQAAGWSVRQFTVAPLALGMICTIFLAFNSVVLLPSGFGAFKERQSDLRAAIPRILLQDKVFVDLAPNLTIFIDERISKTQVRNVFIQDKRDSENITTLTASIGQFLNENGQPILVLENGERSQLDKDGRASATLYFEQYKLNFSRNVTSQEQRRVLDMNEDSIANLLNPETSISEKYVSQRVAYGHYRITSPFLAITLVLIAVAAMTRGRLRDEYNKRRMWHALGAAITVQILFISARSLTVAAPSLWLAPYLLLLVSSAVAGFIIMTPHGFKLSGKQVARS